RWRAVFLMVAVASSTRIPPARARPPKVMMLIVSPSMLSAITELRIESGMDTAMITVLRQLPRKSRIISAVRQGAITAPGAPPPLAAPPAPPGLHEDRLVGEQLDLQRRGQGRGHPGQEVADPLHHVDGGRGS